MVHFGCAERNLNTLFSLKYLLDYHYTDFGRWTCYVYVELNRYNRLVYLSWRNKGAVIVYQGKVYLLVYTNFYTTEPNNFKAVKKRAFFHIILAYI